MKITGHKTDSIFRRYLIVDEELLAQATGAVAELLGDGARPRPGNPSGPRETTNEHWDFSSTGTFRNRLD
jgi:hypothetical protein